MCYKIKLNKYVKNEKNRREKNKQNVEFRKQKKIVKTRMR